jgi:HEAT repeat protein
MRTAFYLAICVVVLGCSKNRALQNSYYDRMKNLADQFEANPSDKAALRKLERYTQNWNEWNRFYAHVYVYELAVKNIGGCRAELIPYIDKALSDPDQATRREAASTICDIGGTAVEQTLPALLQIIQKYQECDDVWFSIEAVSQLRNSTAAAKVLPVLFKVAQIPPPKGTQDEAPQMRVYALDAIEEIAKNNGLNVVDDLEKVKDGSEGSYKIRLGKVIAELERTSSASQSVVTNSIQN